MALPTPIRGRRQPVHRDRVQQVVPLAHGAICAIRTVTMTSRFGGTWAPLSIAAGSVGTAQALRVLTDGPHKAAEKRGTDIKTGMRYGMSFCCSNRSSPWALYTALRDLRRCQVEGEGSGQPKWVDRQIQAVTRP